MIYDTELKVAMKDKDGRYHSADTSIFELEHIIGVFPSLEVKIDKQKEIRISVICPICGEKHEYTYNLTELLKRQMIIGGCEATGLPVWFIGKPIKVSKFVSKFDEINKKIYAML